MSSLKNNFQLGQDIKVKVKIDCMGKKRSTTIEGRIIFMNSFFMTISTGEYNTSINFSSFKQGNVTLLI